MQLGKYDLIILAVCKAISNPSRPVLIRWGHEMEQSKGRYPWAGKSSTEYISAYRHFVSLCKSSGPDLKFIWSPAGDTGSDKYWPGHSFVNYVGLSAFNYKEFTGRSRSFLEIVWPKYLHIKNFNKPIIISESGSTGTDSEKKNWIDHALKNKIFFSQIEAIVYFNSKDVEGVWGKNVPTPDWRIKRY